MTNEWPLRRNWVITSSTDGLRLQWLRKGVKLEAVFASPIHLAIKKRRRSVYEVRHFSDGAWEIIYMKYHESFGGAA